MLIGIDFDNTIVCYDALFHRVCQERNLIPPGVPANKSDVRNHLRQAGREDDWTELQGYVYGARMDEADPYPGVLEFFRDCRRRGVRTCIVSHKTRHPYRGQPYDLHQAALHWLELQGFFDPAGIGLTRANVYWELTKKEKLVRIDRIECTHFIDDLPELLSEPDFPGHVRKILFDPNRLYGGEPEFSRFSEWDDAWKAILPED